MSIDAIQLLRNHWIEAPPADEATVNQAYAYAIRPRYSGRLAPNLTVTRRRPVLAVLVSVALLGAGFGVTALLRTSQRQVSQVPTKSTQSQPGAAGPSFLEVGPDPFGPASEAVTLDQLEAAMSHPIAIPDSPLANRGNVGDVWLNTETGAAVAYWPSSGIEIVWGGIGVDYSGVPAENIRTINGVRAILQPASEFGADFPTSFLLFPEPDGHGVSLATNGSIDDLIAVAETLPVYSSP
ncbi:MAG: hypothetical protein QOG85_1002 [Gaiellaceae bacterium]|jgi:hypothetical protein|nr:hypothetical protein [Gaiellaceae bacterium]